MSARFDIIVIGGGHAGAEAAWAAARMGASTAMITMSIEAIGRMSCNPAIGGLGKGHMVREIDALGGLMGLAIDATGIQFRMLNRGKGPAVWAPRAQADRDLYATEVRRLLAETPNLTLLEGMVEEILTTERVQGCRHGDSSTGFRVQQENAETPKRPATAGKLHAETPIRVQGIRLEDGRIFHADAVVITTGTFLRSLMHCGESKTEGGRIGEKTSRGISRCLEELGLELGRLKTGTPPRVHRDSLDYGVLETQAGDDPPVPFSFLTESIAQPQISCWITYTNAVTHDHIRANLHRAPMYSGQIQSRGPRYCPSIEDKVVRFADKARHQLFLEPEGYTNERIYCNGISTSLPPEVQDELVRSIRGLEEARILQYGYAVEYDFVPTHQIKASLETKAVDGLFLAGQINGTSGYEEAAGQGILAGINAVRKLRGGDAFVLGRNQAYLGVMMDDLVTRPPTEPYRMFTSRAEYRLHLRSDNADRRLSPLGREIGLVDDLRWERYRRKEDEIARIQGCVSKSRYQGQPLAERLRSSTATTDDIQKALGEAVFASFSPLAVEQILIEAKYSGYLARQDRQIARLAEMDSMRIPEGVDFHQMKELRVEAREKFSTLSPRTLGQAGRISGISPADITTLWIYLAGKRRTPEAPPLVRTGSVTPSGLDRC